MGTAVLGTLTQPTDVGGFCRFCGRRFKPMYGKQNPPKEMYEHSTSVRYFRMPIPYLSIENQLEDNSKVQYLEVLVF